MSVTERKDHRRRATKRTDLVSVVWEDLRALCWWAAHGVRRARGGAYSNEIQHIIEGYADHVGLKLERAPRFGADLRRPKAGPKSSVSRR